MMLVYALLGSQRACRVRLVPRIAAKCLLGLLLRAALHFVRKPWLRWHKLALTDPLKRSAKRLRCIRVKVSGLSCHRARIDLAMLPDQTCIDELIEHSSGTGDPACLGAPAFLLWRQPILQRVQFWRLGVSSGQCAVLPNVAKAGKGV
jgi:hypothetical protein